MGPDYTQVSRNLALELVRVTEAAALASGRWLGKGDKNAADQVGGRPFITLVTFAQIITRFDQSAFPTALSRRRVVHWFHAATTAPPTSRALFAWQRCVLFLRLSFLQAAVDMMRKVLNTISMDGVVVIGEGEKDEVRGQQLGIELL